MRDPINNLLKVAATASPEHGEWLRMSLSRYLMGEVSFDTALGMDGNARCRYLESERNEQLRIAWNLVADKPIGPWSRSKHLHRELTRFEAIAWLRVKDSRHPPDNLSDLRKVFFLVLKCGAKIPGERQIHEICTRSQLHDTDTIIQSKVL
ncbi:MAG: hypothetical protein GY752_12220 [bacterium]|nr:hypothetical protein [bacterium]